MYEKKKKFQKCDGKNKNITISSRYLEPCEEYHPHCKEHHIRHGQTAAGWCSTPIQFLYSKH